MAVEELLIRAQMRDEISVPLERMAGNVEAVAQAADNAQDQVTQLGRASTIAAGGVEAEGTAAGVAAGETEALAAASGSASVGQSRLARTIKGVSLAALRALKLALVGTVAGMGAFAYGAVTTASDVGESVSKTTVIFKENADAMVAWSKTTGDSLGLAQGQALDAAANFGAMFIASGKTTKQAGKMSRQFVGLASDLGSFYNVSSDEALEKLRAGLTGESEPLRALNIFLNENAVARRAVAMGIAKEGDELTDQQKILARGAEIMAQANKAGAAGDFQRTLGTSLPNTLKVLKATFTDTLGAIGKDLIPIVLDVAKSLQKILGPALKALGPGIGALVKGLGKALGPVLENLAPAFTILGKVAAQLFEVLGPIVALLAGQLSKVLKALMPAIRPLLKALGDGLLEIFKALKPAILPMVTSTVALVRALVPLIPVLAKIITLGVKMFVPMIQLMGTTSTWFANSVILPLTKIIGAFAKHWGETWRTVGEFWFDVWADIKGFFGGVLSWFGSLPGRIGRAVSGLWDGIVDSFKGAINTVIGWWNNLELRLNLPDNIPGLPDEVVLSTPNIPTFERGGRPPVGAPFLVGERGPEVMVIDRPGTVIPGAYAGSDRQAEVMRQAGLEAEDVYGRGGPLVVIENLHATETVDVERAIVNAVRRLEKDKRERQFSRGRAA